jgi:hypothetical protein
MKAGTKKAIASRRAHFDRLSEVMFGCGSGSIKFPPENMEILWI